MHFTPNIAFINISSAVSDQEVVEVMNALQIQVSRDFFHEWGENANLFFFNRNRIAQIPDDYWWFVITDYSDSSENAGFHDLTPSGLPIAHVPAKSHIDSGYPWSMTASHELLEMIEDPGNNLCARQVDPNGDFVLYAYEVCDPCESDVQGYLINGILVSDFVFPEWFEDFDHPDGTQYDFMNLISEPFQLLEGGYISINKTNSESGWTNRYENPGNISYRMRPRLGSRRERRRTPRREWIRSNPRI